MEELKACPHCGSTNVGISPYDGAKTVVCMNCLCMSAAYRGENAEANAAAAWNRRAALENKVLTLEQLRQMDGEPVWIDGKDYGGWTIFKDSANKQVARCLDNLNLSYYMDDYGKTWLAYARRPESAP